jgi:hypothetical protein
MDVVFYLPDLLASIVFIVGFFSSGIILIKLIETAVYYLKFRSIPLHPAELKYMNLLEENKHLKQKIAQYEEQQEEILEQMIEQLKEK